MPPRAAGILLAAGESRRMGRPKPLLRGPDATFFREAAHAMADADLTPRVAVVPPALAERLSPDAAGACLLPNADPQLGQLHSLRLALRHLSAPMTADGAFVLLVDNPGEVAARIARLSAAIAAPARVHIAAHRSQPGHPMWLPAYLWAGLLAWDGPDGARGFLATLPEPPLLVEAGPAALHDIDTPEEYHRLIAGLRG